MKTFVENHAQAVLIGKYLVAFENARRSRAACKEAKSAYEREKLDRPPMYSPEGSLEWHERNVACELSAFNVCLKNKISAEKYEKKLRHELEEAGLSKQDILELRTLV